MSALPWLDPHNDTQGFPHPEHALNEPNGLLAVGGSLSPRRLLSAYRLGIFPWYSQDQPILWWSPDPRTVLFPERIKISRSLRKTLKKDLFSVTADTAFATVIQRCAEPRTPEDGTWITPEMRAAYCRLHRLGYAHSLETWSAGKLVGGLYGVAIGGAFYGESMFSRMSDASKVALVALARQLQRWDFTLIDCQLYTTHLISLGALELPRKKFTELLRECCSTANRKGRWRLDEGLLAPQQY